MIGNDVGPYSRWTNCGGVAARQRRLRNENPDNDPRPGPDGLGGIPAIDSAPSSRAHKPDPGGAVSGRQALCRQAGGSRYRSWSGPDSVGSSRTLNVRAERHDIAPAGTLSEFRYGSFARHVVLPPDSDPHDVSASCHNGIVTVRIGIKFEHQQLPRRIDVSIEP